MNSSQVSFQDQAFFYYRHKKYEKAAQLFLTALEENENADLYYYRGKALLSSGKALASAGCFEKARELCPDNPKFYLAAIDAMLHLGFPDRVLFLLKTAQNFSIQPRELLKREGAAFLQKSNYQKAVECFLSVLKTGERNFVIYAEIGSAYYFQGKYNDAKKYFNRASHLVDHKSNFYRELLYYKALTLRKLGFYRKVLSELKKIQDISNTTRLAAIFRLRGICYFYLKKYTKALFCMDISLGECPNVSSTYKYKAIIFNKMGFKEKAATYFSKAQQVASENQQKRELMKLQFQTRADILQKEIEHYENRTAIYNQQLEKDPENAALYVQKAAVLFDLQQYHETISCCNNALKRNPHEKNALRDKSRALFALGRYREALRCLTQFKV